MADVSGPLTEVSSQVEFLGPRCPFPEEHAVVGLPLRAVRLVALREIIKVSLRPLHLGQALFKQPVPAVTPETEETDR